MVNWKTLFNNKTVKKQVSIFDETISNIFSNFVPKKLVTFDDSDPPWINYFIKNKKKKNGNAQYIKPTKKWSKR